MNYWLIIVVILVKWLKLMGNIEGFWLDRFLISHNVGLNSLLSQINYTIVDRVIIISICLIDIRNNVVIDSVSMPG